MSHFEETRKLFWDGPHNLKLQSDDKDNISVGYLLSKLSHHTNRNHFIPKDLTCAGPVCMAVLQWN